MMQDLVSHRKAFSGIFKCRGSRNERFHSNRIAGISWLFLYAESSSLSPSVCLSNLILNLLKLPPTLANQIRKVNLHQKIVPNTVGQVFAKVK